MECSKCGRRFAAPEILESGRCPRCGGDLVPLEEAREPDQPGGNHQGG
jgi:predicted Zn-ribbon and HTH transcriptional regulator